MMQIILATKNSNKLKEFRAMLQGCRVSLSSLERFPGCPDIVEDGDSFTENALKKARVAAAHTGLVAMADDSGLEVDALDGRPGIFSARFAGPGALDADNNAKLLGELDGLPPRDRGAQFCCVIVLVAPQGPELTVSGSCRGIIITQPRGRNGFGYDPLFLDEASGLTFAEMPAEHKNRISHRSRAIMALLEVLPAFLERLEKSRHVR